MPVEFENDEEKKATKVVEDMVIQLKETRAIVKMMDRQTRAPRISAKLGEIKQDIYRYNSRPQDEDPLSNLPAELQHWIWSHLVSPADRLMLALTCKSHAAVFEGLKASSLRSAASKKSTKVVKGSKSAPRINPARSKPPTKMDKLYILYRLQDWMPTGYRLCCECVRFRSRTRTIRKAALTFVAKEGWSGRKLSLGDDGHDEKEVMKQLKEAIKTGSRCPECCQRAHLDTVSAKKAHQELKREIAKML